MTVQILLSDLTRQLADHPPTDYEAVVSQMSEEEVHELAAEALAARVNDERRRRALIAEREAEYHTLSPLAQWDRDRRERRKRIGKENRDLRRRQEAEAREAGFSSPTEHAHALLEQAIADWTEHIRMEWTQELLGSDFALRDGTRVTWGAATVAQHSERRAMFADNAKANLEGAARHQHAIQALTESGARSLNAMVRTRRKAVA